MKALPMSPAAQAKAVFPHPRHRQGFKKRPVRQWCVIHRGGRHSPPHLEVCWALFDDAKLQVRRWGLVILELGYCAWLGGAEADVRWPTKQAM